MRDGTFEGHFPRHFRAVLTSFPTGQNMLDPAEKRLSVASFRVRTRQGQVMMLRLRAISAIFGPFNPRI